MDALHLYLFGRFQACWNERTLDSLDSSKVQELLCYLLLNREHAYSREHLAELLWPDCLAGQSRKYLRQVLWQLRSALNAQIESLDTHVLQVDSGFVAVNPNAKLWLDVDAFERAFNVTRDMNGQDLDDEEIRLLQDAVALHKADLLETWYQDWCLYERERLRSIYVIMLDKLMDACISRREYETGITYGNLILRYDIAHERTHRKLMQLYYQSGDRTAALRQYRRCVAILDKELGVMPTRITITLYEQMTAGQLSDPAMLRSEVELGLSAELPPKLHKHLARLPSGSD